MTGQPDWLTLDNAAKIYPASSTHEAPQVFRLRLDFAQPIRFPAIEEALAAVVSRCPYFQVHLRRGLFWYYLQRHDAPVSIELLDSRPITHIDLRKDTHLLVVKARGRSLAVDFSHVLTDGAGALRFLLSLATEYLRRRGESVEAPEGFLDPATQPEPEEYVDSHKEYFLRDSPSPNRFDPAFHLPGGSPHRGYYRVLTALLELDAVRRRAKSLGASLTEYTVAAYLFVLLRIRRTLGGSRRPIIRIEVPVNMRHVRPSKSMRNFSLFVSPEVDARVGEYSFEELVLRVHHTLRSQVDHRELLRQIGRNVRGELNPFVRGMPLVLKDLLLSAVHTRLGPNLYSGVVSNLGPVLLPESLERHIESVRFFLGPSPTMKTNCSLLSYRGTLVFSLGSVLESRRFERELLYHLRDEGFSVAVREE